MFDLVRSHLTYVPGSTAVSTTATDAFVAASGVCQDFVHISLALLRSIGIPARYVSGYVHNRPDAMLGESVRGESHAWVDVWTGDWWGYDPTGDIATGERHVVVATGRDYKDVAPAQRRLRRRRPRQTRSRRRTNPPRLKPVRYGETERSAWGLA